jgi:hypothetical protein
MRRCHGQTIGASNLRTPRNPERALPAAQTHQPREPVFTKRDAMRASPCQGADPVESQSSFESTMRRLRGCLVVCLLLGACSAFPSQGFAKTRPPVEMGDPDDTNEKPRPSASHTWGSGVFTSAVRSQSQASRTRLDVSTLIRTYLRAWLFLR